MSDVARRRAFTAGGLLAAVVLVVAGVAVLSARPPAGGGTTLGVAGTVVEGVGGRWTNVTPDTLASLLPAHELTLLNVKTPYIGEIEGTDLYIPYTDLTGRAAELPSDRTARIVVYCRSGAQSAIAAQTLLDLGYTNVLNLDGGVNAWVAGGRGLVQLDRS